MSPDPRYAHDLDVILTVTQAMTRERDLDRLLAIILDAAQRLIRADRCSLFLVDRERRELWTRIAHGSATIRLPLGSGLAGAVAASAQPVNIIDAYHDQRFNRDSDQLSGYRTRSMLCMPLISHEETVVGVLQALNKQGASHFDAYDERILHAFCSQAAVAIDTAMLIARDLERQRLVREMEIARGIQQGLLPARLPDLPGWRFHAWQRCCDETGGDYYDFLPLADRLDLVVGDVCGHGIGAALLMSTTRAFLRAIHSDGLQPDRLLARLNRLLAADLKAESFVTLALCRLDAGGGCRFATAGHPPPLVYRRGRAAFDALDSTGMLLGAFAEGDYDAHDITPLERGDLLVAFTDGVVEANSAAGRAWGLEAFHDAVAQAAAAGAAAVAEAVVAALTRHRAAAPAADDMTLVVAERTA